MLRTGYSFQTLKMLFLLMKTSADIAYFYYNEYGKPFVKGFEPFFDFSVSHAGDLVTVAFGPSKVGVDVEKIGSAGDIDELLHFLSERELRSIDSSEDREKEFYRIWTRREALGKKEGMGLLLYEEMPERSIFEDGSRFFEYGYPDKLFQPFPR